MWRATLVRTPSRSPCELTATPFFSSWQTMDGARSTRREGMGRDTWASPGCASGSRPLVGEWNW